MSKKLRQVTDSIHGTIYLSELESELISTPYFYRLHDVYQSSTVYMTFPNNRTKRYEHSLGTMELASRMLFSSVANTDSETLDILFNKLKGYFFEIVDKVATDCNCESLYFKKDQEYISDFFERINIEQGDENYIEYLRNSILSVDYLDTALNCYQYYPTKCMDSIFETTTNGNAEYIYLYRCLLQAIRIVALFHDVGHPPYSHIIEDVLQDLYEEIEIYNDKDSRTIANKINTFKRCLDPFFTKEPEKVFKCKRLLSESSLVDAKPHERIGLGLLTYAVNDVIHKKVHDIVKQSTEKGQTVANVLYYITIVEFVFAILTEKDMFFKSFHKIVDGAIDADRLDYIVRDSQNSGVDWGTIPYDRIINSSKLFHLKEDNNGIVLDEVDQPFVIAYPQKITDDIEDLLLVRYKIFARINYHHRCMKTAMALKAAVKDLAIDYLTKIDTKCVNTDIQILWTALDTKMGNKKMRVIQWNDSWLISTLHKALVALHTNEKNGSELLKENLEEILLNKKKYYSLIKRGSDNCNFVQMVFKKINITKDDIDKLKHKEFEKYYGTECNSTEMTQLFSNPKSNALDSIARVSDIFKTLDLESLCKLIPLQGDDFKKIIEEDLGKHQNLTRVTAIINDGRQKNGLPKHNDVLDGIYLYNDEMCMLYNEHYSLSDQIESLTKNIPWLYVYFIPTSTVTNICVLKDQLIEQLSDIVGEKLKLRFDELFNGNLKSE